MNPGPPDLSSTPLLLPPDAKLLSVADLAPRLRAKLDAGTAPTAVVVTRPGFRVVTRLIPAPLAALVAEFRTASLVTDAVLRFSRAQGQDPRAILDLSFDALAALVDGRFLVDAAAPDAGAGEPSLAAGQCFAALEIETLLRALDDSEVYRARTAQGAACALKVARDGRAAEGLRREAGLLAQLGGGDTPRLLGHGAENGRAWLAMEWRDGVSVAVAAQQARAARDRVRLHRLVTRLAEAYARLHARGVVHGDVHPGNILVAADGRITILDFGQARLVADGAVPDPSRAGIAHFHDPQMAAAILAGAVPHGATPASEQYALAALTDLLLTGQHHVAPAAEQAVLLARIADRPPLPFAARGVAAWPRVEAVLRRALAKAPDDRFVDTTAFARALRAAGTPQRRPAARRSAIVPALALLHAAAPWAGVDPARLAWIALRAALLRGDPELLAVADLRAAQAGDGPDAQAIAAAVARARSDRLAEAEAIAGFLAAAGRSATDLPRALLLAAPMLEGAALRGVDSGPLRSWAERALAAAPRDDVAMLHATLALGQAGVVAVPAGLPARLAAVAGGSVWFWALAHDVLADPGHAARALAAPRPRDPVGRALACLRLHQMSGATRWVAAARRAAAQAAPGPEATLLAIEMEAPWRALPAPWLCAATLAARGPLGVSAGAAPGASEWG